VPHQPLVEVRLLKLLATPWRKRKMAQARLQTIARSLRALG
jgi:hypothetical protein